jgi:hypothetical protein
MLVAWCSTFHRRPTFWKSQHPRSHEPDEQLTPMVYLSESNAHIGSKRLPAAAELTAMYSDRL